MRRLALALALAPSLAAAHPHVFVDGGVGFTLDAEGRLAALEIEWRFEPFYTTLILEEFGLGQTPDAAGLATLAAMQPDWARDFGGEGVLKAAGAPVALGPATAAAARVEDGALTLTFTRTVLDPLDPAGLEIVAEVYDPTFFVAYTLVGRPRVAGPGAERCEAVVNPFDPMGEATDLLGALMTLGPDETPSDPDVGALFTDRAALRCG